MEFEPNESQSLVQDTARSFAQRMLKPRAAEFERNERVPDEVLRSLAELGLMGVNVSSRWDGAEAGAVAYSLALTELAQGCSATAVTMAVSNMVAEVLERFGTDAQREKYLSRLVRGELGCGSFALSEAGAGSDPGSMTSTAHKEGRTWVLQGTKQWITSGDRAGLLIVWARTGAPGTAGLSAFLVEGNTPGLRVDRHEDKMGLRGSSTVALSFERCELPEEALLGELHGGFKIAMMALDGGRIGIASQALGIGLAALEAATAYAKERQQFGKSLAEFQAIQWMLADSKVEMDASRALALRAAWLKERQQSYSREAAMAKLFASEKAFAVCDRALQIHGGYGYTKDFPVERYLRDVRVTRIYEGTSEIQRVVLARHALR